MPIFDTPELMPPRVAATRYIYTLSSYAHILRVCHVAVAASLRYCLLYYVDIHYAMRWP